MQRLIGARHDQFADYQQPQFEAAFLRRFRSVRTAPIEGTRRTLYLFEAVQSDSA